MKPEDALHLKVRGVALWIKTLRGEVANSAFETLLKASDALATSAPRTAIKWPEKRRHHLDNDEAYARTEGYNEAIAACRAAVAAAEGETKP